MALPTLKDVKRHFQKNYKLYIAIGIIVLTALAFFLLTFFCPLFAFFSAGVLAAMGWEAAAAFSTLAIAGIMAGVGAALSLFCNIVAAVSHRVKTYFDKKLITDPEAYEQVDHEDDLDNEKYNQFKKLEEVPGTFGNNFDNGSKGNETYKMFIDKTKINKDHDELTFTIPAYQQEVN